MKRILGMIACLALATQVQAGLWPYTITNATPYTAKQVGAGFYTCSSRQLATDLKSGEVVRFTGNGGCQIDSVWADMYVPSAEPTATERINLTPAQLIARYPEGGRTYHTDDMWKADRGTGSNFENYAIFHKILPNGDHYFFTRRANIVGP